MAPRDLVLLLRRTSPDVAVGWVTGPYQHRTNLGRSMRQVRAVHWSQVDLPRAVVAAELLNLPPLAMIFRISQPDTADRLRRPVGAAVPSDVNGESSTTVKESGPFVNLQRNLNYARNLATAGQHLAKLEVRSFEVSDVFRAAWVQSVAGLDHWVRQEIRERMLRLANQPDTVKPEGFKSFPMTLDLLERVRSGDLSLVEALDRQLRTTRGHLAYQQADRIREGFALVADVSKLWERVAKVLSEQAGDGVTISGKDVQQRLREIAYRRNKIAHESDQEENNPRAKRPIDEAMVTQTIDWIEQLAGAVVVVLDQK